MVPRLAKTTSTIREKYSLSCATSASGSPRSVIAVKPRMSENSTLIVRRRPPSSASAGLASTWSKTSFET